MKMKNNRGLVVPELMAILAFIAIILAVGSYFAFKGGDSRKYDVFIQHARDFSSKVASYRNEYIKYYDEIYLYDLVSDNYIQPFKNPFRGGGNCDLYESKVVTKLNGERYVTLKCGDYLIDSQKASDNSYKVYKVSNWKETMGNAEMMESSKLYNYEKDGKLVLKDYVILKEFISLYNENENKNITTLDDIDLNKHNILTKTFYRTKELVKENL